MKLVRVYSAFQISQKSSLNRKSCHRVGKEASEVNTQLKEKEEKVFNEKMCRLKAFPKTCPLNIFISELKGEKVFC